MVVDARKPPVTAAVVSVAPDCATEPVAVTVRHWTAEPAADDHTDSVCATCRSGIVLDHAPTVPHSCVTPTDGTTPWSANATGTAPSVGRSPADVNSPESPNCPGAAI